MRTTIYSAIHRRWHRRAEAKVAAQSPEWAAIEARRHKEGRNTVTFLSANDDLTIDHWKRQSEIFEAIAPWPWWLRALAWREHNNITVHGMRRRVKKFVQRGRRGWADEDLWSLDSHLCAILPHMLRQLAAADHGHPCQLTQDGWHEILETMAVGFEAAGALVNLTYDEDRETLEKQFDVGFDLFHKFFFNLWS